jgi:hypothetical protein
MTAPKSKATLEVSWGPANPPPSAQELIERLTELAVKAGKAHALRERARLSREHARAHAKRSDPARRGA